MKFTTVFFDIDYCLLATPTSERRIIRELYAQQGQTVGDEVGDTYREINRKLWVYLDAGQITRERLYVMRFERLFERYPFFKPAEEVAPWFLDQLAHAYDPQQGAAHLLERLHNAGARLFTASNGIGEVMNGRVANAGLSKWLDGKFAADDVGAMKPSPKYFDTIFKRSGVFPNPPNYPMSIDKLSKSADYNNADRFSVCFYNKHCIFLRPPPYQSLRNRLPPYQ